MKMPEGFLLQAAMALEDFEDRWLEVVVDHQAWYSAPELKGVALAQQERFLPLGRKDLTEHCPAEAQPSSQEGQLHQLPIELHLRMPKVKLGPLARGKLQRQVGGFRLLTLLPHQLAHRRFGNGDALLA
jgi:hypothetical protein